MSHLGVSVPDYPAADPVADAASSIVAQHQQVVEGGHVYEVAIAVADQGVAVEFVCCDEDGRPVSQLTGKLSVEDLTVASDLLSQALTAFAGLLARRPGARAHTVEQKRREHPNAYKPWLPEDEQRLRQLFEDGVPIPQLCGEFGRNRGAILARLTKLGFDVDSLRTGRDGSAAPGAARAFSVETRSRWAGD